MKKWTCVLLAALLLLALCPVPARAAIATDTVTIRVGYVGGPYYEKATFHWRDLDDFYGGALSTQEVLYSYYSGSRVALCAARGFLLTDLLELAGVDISGVLELSFWTDDQAVGAWTSFQKEELLDRPRYYYPNLSADENGTLLPLRGGEPEDGAQRVDCMLALEDNWEWDAESDIFQERGFDFMSATGRFRLLFGQAYPTEARTMQAAKYVHTIDVTFAGKPVFGAEDNLELKVGQDFRAQVNISAADSLLEEYLRDQLVWSSNNTDVVEADLYGNLRPKAAGEAVITASVGDEAIRMTVRVSPAEAPTESAGAGELVPAGEEPSQAPPEEETPPEEPEPPPEEPEEVPPEEAPQEAEPPEEAPPREELPEEQEPAGSPEEEPQPEEVAFSEASAGVYILSSRLMARTEYAEWVNSVLDHPVVTDSAQGDVMNWREDALSPDAAQLILEERPEPDRTLPLLLSALGLLLLGVLWGLGRDYLLRKEKIG